MQVLTARIRKLNMRLTQHCFLQAKHRICVEIMRLSRPRLGHERQRVISPPPLQREIAERVGTRREVVSRQISVLRKMGVVEKTQRALVIKDISAINKIIDEGWDDD
jgi:CRP/FNR family cyclic AMP-dependent transcriptional regulator